MRYLDTSLLVPLLVPEPASDRVQRWLERQAEEALSISEWTLTEFASAMGLKVRAGHLQSDQARRAQVLLEKLAAESFVVQTPTRADYVKAGVFLSQYSLGLRAGDALHLAIAYNNDAEVTYSLDRLFVAAGRKLKIKTERPI